MVGEAHGDRAFCASRASPTKPSATLELWRFIGPVRVVVSTCAGTGNAIRVLSRDGVFPALAAFRKIVDINLVGTFNVHRLGAERIAKMPNRCGKGAASSLTPPPAAAFDGQIGQAATRRPEAA